MSKHVRTRRGNDDATIDSASNNLFRSAYIARLGARNAGMVEARYPDEDIVAWYVEGLSLRKIAARTGYAIETIRRRLVENGVTLRPQGVKY